MLLPPEPILALPIDLEAIELDDLLSLQHILSERLRHISMEHVRRVEQAHETAKKIAEEP